MITCKDQHVMATGSEDELMMDLGAIAAALVQNKINWVSVMAASAAGVEHALDQLRDKEASNG